MSDPLALEEEWARIVRDRDREAADEFLSEDFVLSSEGGVAPNMPREAWLDALSKIETERLDVSDAEARRLGDVLAIRARLRWEARMGDRDLTGDYAVVDLFTRESDRWRASWRVSTRVRHG